MSSQLTNNFPALEMAHCPNCGHAIQQLGASTNCSKCGKQLTIRCLSCQINNPPVFQFCMKCGADFRVIGVEHYHKQLAKLDFDLAEHARLKELQKRALLLHQLFQLTAPVLVIVTSLYFYSSLPITVYLTMLFALLAITYLSAQRFGHKLSQRLAGISAELAKDWPHHCRSAEKQLAEKQEIEQTLAYYQQELNQFRQKRG